jgi:hypothetical protein
MSKSEWPREWLGFRAVRFPHAIYEATGDVFYDYHSLLPVGISVRVLWDGVWGPRHPTWEDVRFIEPLTKAARDFLEIARASK